MTQEADVGPVGDEQTSPVRLAVDSGVAHLVLAAPDRGNALDLTMVTALRDAVRSLAGRDDVRVVRLSAQGRSFSVGGDLSSFSSSEPAAVEAHVRLVAQTAREAVEALRALPVPVVSQVHGSVAGGGIGVALAADVVVLGRTARLVPAYPAVGLSPDCGVSVLLARTLGPARALDLVLTNRIVSADEAEQWGLASRVVDDDALEATVDAIVAGLLRVDTAGLAAAKRLVLQALDGPAAPVLDAEVDSIARLAAGAPAQTAIRAFLDRRAASRA